MFQRAFASMQVDVVAIKEVVPSLMISLAGLILMSKLLDNHADEPLSEKIPHMFILNAMLSFKNNIELNYADIMSTSTKKIFFSRKHGSSLDMLGYVIDCGTKMFSISSAVSILIGIGSSYRPVLDIMGGQTWSGMLFLVGTLSVAFLSGVSSSMCIFICVIACIMVSLVFSIDPDNVILPVVASAADYISTASILYFSDGVFLVIKDILHLSADTGTPRSFPAVASKGTFLTNSVLISLLSAVLVGLYMTNRTRKTPELFNLCSLLAAFAITMVAGAVLQVISSRNKRIGILTPLFNGLAGSVALIYTSKVTTYSNFISSTAPSTETNAPLIAEIENPNSFKMLNTLLLTAALLSFVSSTAIYLLFKNIPVLYVVMMALFLVLEVWLLFLLVNCFVFMLQWFNIGVSCHVVPLMNASSDLLGTLVFGVGMSLVELLFQ